jgi:hypothetical protein
MLYFYPVKKLHKAKSTHTPPTTAITTTSTVLQTIQNTERERELVTSSIDLIVDDKRSNKM